MPRQRTQESAATKVEFVVFRERNRKEHETYYFYLQKDGNDKALKQLADVIVRHDGIDPGGDGSSYDLYLEHTISEDAAEQHRRLGLDAFVICRGHLDLPDRLLQDLDDEDFCELIDETLCAGKVEHLFSAH